MNTSYSAHPKPRPGRTRLLFLVLAVSVLANLAMALVLSRRPNEPIRPTAPPLLRDRPSNPFWQPPRSPAQTKADLSRFAGIWSRFESSDYGALIRNLRAVGCPEPAIRDIIIPRIDAEFEKRQQQELPKPEYWRTASQFAALKRRIVPRLAALEVQKHQTIRSFWPPEGSDPGEARWRAFGLSSIKGEQFIRSTDFIRSAE